MHRATRLDQRAADAPAQQLAVEHRWRTPLPMRLPPASACRRSARDRRAAAFRRGSDSWRCPGCACVPLRSRSAPRRRRADSQALNTTSGGSRPSADRCVPVSSPSASARPPSPGLLFIEGGVTGVVNDVVAARFEFGGHARERRGVAGDFGEPHRLAAARECARCVRARPRRRADRRSDSRSAAHRVRAARAARRRSAPAPGRRLHSAATVRHRAPGTSRAG